MEDWKLKKAWTEEEDAMLAAYVAHEGKRSWNMVREKMGLYRNGFSCWRRWTTYLKPKLTPAPGVKGTENEVKYQNLPSVLNSTPCSQNVGVLPMDNILTDITNKRGMFSSGYSIHGKREVKSQNLHSVLHSTPPARSQNVGVLPMDNILIDITNKRSMFSFGDPIQRNKRFRAAEATSSNPSNMFVKPGAELARNKISAASGTQQSAAFLSGSLLNSNPKELPSLQRIATLTERINVPTSIGTQRSAIQSGTVLNSNSKEPPSLQRNAALPERMNSHKEYAKGIGPIPTSSLTDSNANQSTLCKEYEGYIAQAPSDAKLGIPVGGIMESGCLIISQGTDYPMEELLGQIEERVMSDPMEELLGQIEEQEMSESQLAPSSLVKEQVERRVDHLVREFEMLVQNSGTTVVQNNISAPVGTQRPAVIRSDNLSTSISKELPSLQTNSTLPEQISWSRVQGARDAQSLPTTSLNASDANLGIGLCNAFKEHEGSIAHGLSDAKHATSVGGMAEGSHSIVPQGIDHMMDEQLGQTAKQERSENLDGDSGECGTLIQYPSADESDAEIYCLLRGFLDIGPSPYLYSP